MHRVRTRYVHGVENSSECIVRMIEEDRTKKKIQEDTTHKILEGSELKDIGIKCLFSLSIW